MGVVDQKTTQPGIDVRCNWTEPAIPVVEVKRSGAPLFLEPMPAETLTSTSEELKALASFAGAPGRRTAAFDLHRLQYWYWGYTFN